MSNRTGLYENIFNQRPGVNGTGHDDTPAPCRFKWRLLWIPPSLPYYRGGGAFADPALATFTKRLVFSCWRVVPKALASILSYEAERLMMHTFRKKARNTPEARKKRRPLLRFTFREGRPTGMPVLSLIYPCQALARRFDPLALLASAPTTGHLHSLDALINQIASEVAEMLAPLTAKCGRSEGPVDESWYWAAPLLLDLAFDESGVRQWFSQPGMEGNWAGGLPLEEGAGVGWSRHVQFARKVINGQTSPADLGPPPPDLARTIALLAIAGPGVAALRALSRIAVPGAGTTHDLRQPAAPLAHAFLHLFNLPEVMALLRDREKQIPYWRSALEYCAAGNLQAMLDEYAHVLVESLGVVGRGPAAIASAVSGEMQRGLTLRVSTAQADLIVAGKRRVRMGDAIRLRTRFAMRFGDQDSEGSEEPTRADQVRAAFNSPFWPFVLGTTSVGQEGLDFHTYCHAVVHWNLPSNPVDLEQREGRVHRYKGHALRKNIASAFASATVGGVSDAWSAMFAAAKASRPRDRNDLYPFWVAPGGPAKIERHVMAFPLSRDILRHENLKRSLVLYRMVFGQNRQEDLVNYLAKRLPVEDVPRYLALCRVDLGPPVC